jgi:hypothetical protein
MYIVMHHSDKLALRSLLSLVLALLPGSHEGHAGS